jgi:uncharacterized protein YjbI with pentapeptide repeats
VVQDGSGQSLSQGGPLNSGRLAGREARAGRRLRALSLASLGALLAVGVALAPVAPAQEQPQEQEIGLLFAQTANRGTMKPIPGPTPRFNLRLRGVNSQVVWFQDRPGRSSGHIPVPEFTRAWAGFGFVEVPPNAALTLLHAGDRQDTVVMELGQPHFKKKKSRIRYSAQLLDEATGNLSHLNSDLDPRVNRRFRAPSLFIDDAAGWVVNGCVIQPYTTKCPKAVLSGANLTEANLTEANLSGANLSGAILRRAFLREANLAGADLTGANLNSALLVKANLRLADLSGADLSGADRSAVNAFQANLSGAVLSGANLTDAGLREANLTGADLSGANLTDANLRFANLVGAVLTRANLSRANLGGVDLGRANLSGANLSGANLTDALFCRTTMPDGSINNRDC